MQKSALVCFLLLSASLAMAQMETTSITVSVSRSSKVQPDQAVLQVNVQSGLNTSLDDVLTAVQGAGITMANFAGVNSGGNPYTTSSTLTWVFSLTVPLSKLQDTTATLTALQQAITQANGGLTVSFAVQGTQVSAQALQAQACSLAGLVSDAQTQAQNLAAAAGVTVGPILALSSSIPATSSATFVAALSDIVLAPSVPPCALTVRFVLFR